MKIELVKPKKECCKKMEARGGSLVFLDGETLYCDFEEKSCYRYCPYCETKIQIPTKVVPNED